jgi:histidine triad (HIT) family protein
MSECLFCKIRDGEIPGDIVYENDHVLAFNDINPVAPTHILIIPKEHISTLNDLKENHTQTMGEIFLAAKELASREGFAESGYRTIFNCNEYGQQTVFHIHLHLIGGRQMSWPPG